MLKKIILSTIIAFLFGSIVYSYTNPFWEYKNKHVYKIYTFVPDKLIFNFSNSVDITRGITAGLFYEYNSSLSFSDSLFFNLNLNLGENIPRLKTFDTGIFYRPIKYLAFDINYKFRDFSQYQIAEHNLIVKTIVMLNFIKYFTCNIESGFSLRFMDLNINDFKTQYRSDWLFNASFKWRILMMVHPCYFLSFGASLGNISEYEEYSFNYWQVEFLNYFHIPEGFSIFLNGGFGYAGSLPMAGIINKGWVRLGLRYEIKTR